MAALTSEIHKKKTKSKMQESEKLYRIISTKSVKGNTQREDNAETVPLRAPSQRTSEERESHFKVAKS